MSDGRTRVLLIEDNPGDARLIERTFAESGSGRLVLEHCPDLTSGLERLDRGSIDAVLLDLSLPDSDGLDSVLAVKGRAPRVPIVVMSGLDSEAVALLAVQQGAQDYLVKGTGPNEQVVRALLYAVERKRAEDELRQAKAAAEAASLAKTQFVAVVSHEIRSPMTAIVGYAELLHETELTQEQEEYLERLGRSARNLLELTNDLLDLVAAEGRLPELQRVDFDLRELVEELATSFALQSERKGIRLVWEVAPDLPRWRSGDPTRLRQVLANLIGNAIKFTDQGQVSVRVMRDPGASASSILFSVADSGIGIATERQEIIFDAFTQADASIRERYGGSGLGLALSKRLVELMGGRIWVESDPGRGSRFNFTANLGVAVRRVETTAIPEMKGMRVLVVDDDPVLRAELKAILAPWGAVVTEATGGAEAIGKIKSGVEQSRPFQWILLDCRMPGVGGFRVAEAFRSEPAVLSRILMLLPPNPRQDDPGRARDLGLAGILVKPVAAADLARQIGMTVAREAVPARAPVPDDGARRRRVLLVEDSRDVQAMVRLFLRNSSVDLDVADNGKVGVEKFMAGQYDLVLMDIQMPVMDGRAAASAIRAWEEDRKLHRVPIIALTAHAMAEEMKRSIEAGCTGFLTKPVTKQQLLTTIRENT